MMDNLPPLKPLRAFEAAARLNSFKNAAQELSVTQGAISYQIKILEDYLGVPLFERQTRRIVLTRAGNQLHQVVNQVFRDLRTGVEKILPVSNAHILTVSVSTFFTTRWLSPRLGQFINANPDIKIRIEHSVNDPEHSFDESDFSIRWGSGRWPGFHSELLLDSPMMALCSPNFFQNKPPEPEQLDDRVFLMDQPGNDYWSEWLALAGCSNTENVSGPLIADPNVRVQAAIDGHGMVLGNNLLRPELESRTLIEPFPFRLQNLGFYLVYRSDILKKNHCALFRNWLLEVPSAH